MYLVGKKRINPCGGVRQDSKNHRPHVKCRLHGCPKASLLSAPILIGWQNSEVNRDES